MLRQWCFTSEYSRARVEVPVKLKEVGSGVSSTSKELSIARRLNGWIPVCSNAFVTVVRFMLSIAKRTSIGTFALFIAPLLTSRASCRFCSILHLSGPNNLSSGCKMCDIFGWKLYKWICFSTQYSTRRTSSCVLWLSWKITMGRSRLRNWSKCFRYSR